MIEGRAWIETTFGAERAARVAEFLERVVEENGRQNLIAPSTIPAIWERHALDSAQLLRFDRGGLWIDIGTGGGFPGMIVALLREGPIKLVEPRAKRAAFLAECVTAFGLSDAEVVAAKVERLAGFAASIVTARAVASVPALIEAAAGCTDRSTRWVLPRGRTGPEEVEALGGTWQGVFHVKRSLADPDSTIAILEQVQRR